VILVDANILIYASNAEADQHAGSREWLDAKLGGAAPVGIPWPTVLAFLRIATNPRAFRRPLTMAAAWDQVSTWLSAETVWIPEPTERHAAVLGGVSRAARRLRKSRHRRSPRGARDRPRPHVVLDRWGLCTISRT
jgi:toxin-antitoxin system PIN domain toxin